MRQLKHGILNDDGLLTVSGWKWSKIQISQIQNISDVCDLAKNHNLLQIWIVGQSEIFRKLSDNHETTLQENQRWNFAPKEIKHLHTCWQPGAKVQIIFAGNYFSENKKSIPYKNLRSDFGLYQITDAKRLFSAVAWLYEKLGVYPSGAVRTGKRLAEISANEHLEELNEETEMYHANYAKDLILWNHSALKNKKYIYGFDKNRAYLVAASSINFGLGDSIRQSGGEFNKDFSGLWKIELSDKLDIKKGAEKYIKILTENEFLWTQDVQLLIDLGCKIKVVEANIWKFNKRIFEKFYKILVGAIIEAKVHHLSFEAQTLKNIYTQFFGWLASKKGFSEKFYRPDWYFAIIAGTRANMIRNIFTIQKANPEIQIVGVHRDTLILATNEPEISNLPFPLQPNEKSNSPYKFLYRFERSEIEKILNIKSASEIDGQLKTLWKEKEIESNSAHVASIPKMSELRVYL